MKRRERMPLKKRAALTARGYRMLGSYCPGLVRDKALCALILAVQPLFTVWFSARILDEIAGSRRAEILLGYALATLAGNFVLQLFKSAVEKVCGQKEAQMWALFGKVFSDKQMRMDYVDLENARVQAQKKQAEENLFMFGNGLAQLVWGTTGLVRGAVSLAASAAMTVSLFLQSGRVGWLNSPLWALALFLCALLAGLCQSWSTVRENQVFEKWCAGTVWYNRVFMFFGRELYMEPARAKDVRIYAQQGAADRALQALLRHDEADCRTYAQMAAYPALGRLAVGLSYALSYGFVALKALFGAFGVGSVVQYVGALQQFGAGIQEMLFVLADNAVYCRHLESLYAFLDLPNRKYQGTLPVEKRAFCQDGDMEYEIELRNVSFRYPGSETWALRGVSARLCAGTRWPSSGRMAAAKPRLSSCSAACTIPTRARFCSTASISANTIMRSTCGCSLWCFRISACWRSRWAKTWPLPRMWTRSARGNAWRARAWAGGWPPCRKGWKRPCIRRRAAWRSLGARRRRSRSRGRCIATRPSSCWMSPPPRSIPWPNSRCTRALTRLWASAPPCTSATGWPPAAFAGQFGCSMGAALCNRARMKRCWARRRDCMPVCGARRHSIISGKDDT